MHNITFKPQKNSTHLHQRLQGTYLSVGFFMFLLNQTDIPLQTSPHMPWTPEPASRKQVSQVWREQKQLWEACLYWPAATVTGEGASISSSGATVKAEAT